MHPCLTTALLALLSLRLLPSALAIPTHANHHQPPPAARQVHQQAAARYNHHGGGQHKGSSSSSSAPAPSSTSKPAQPLSTSTSNVYVTSTVYAPPPTTTAGPSSSAHGKHTSSAPAASPSSAPPSGGSLSPVWAVYSDAWISGENGPPDPSDLEGYNVLIMSFLLSSGPADQALEWSSLGAQAQSAIKAKYQAAGIKLMVSAFGSTDLPTTAGLDPAATANTMAKWVIDNQLDGLDVDYEEMGLMQSEQTPQCEQWLVTFTQTLRQQLPAGQYFISHAPVAPWFSASRYPQGGYMKVDKEVGSIIDWYNVQFYNQGATTYTDCDSIISQSPSSWPGTSLFEMHANGVDLNKLLIGKPGVAADASNGFMDPASLATCVAQAQAQGWSGGVMAWQYPHANSAWIQTVRGSSWPVSS